MFDHPIAKMLVLSGILVLLVVVTHEAIHPLERMMFGASSTRPILFYLPLGFWVLVAYYERWWAAIHLAPGFAIGLALYGHPDLPAAWKALQMVVMTTTAPFVFAILSWSSGRANEPVHDRFAWRFILVAGGITALVNALGLNLVRHGQLPDTATLEAVLDFSVGGFVGLLTCLLLLAITFRLSRQRPFSG
jgi:hypothetical protein